MCWLPDSCFFGQLYPKFMALWLEKCLRKWKMCVGNFLSVRELKLPVLAGNKLGCICLRPLRKSLSLSFLPSAWTPERNEKSGKYAIKWLQAAFSLGLSGSL